MAAFKEKLGFTGEKSFDKTALAKEYCNYIETGQNFRNV